MEDNAGCNIHVLAQDMLQLFDVFPWCLHCHLLGHPLLMHRMDPSLVHPAYVLYRHHHGERLVTNVHRAIQDVQERVLPLS